MTPNPEINQILFLDIETVPNCHSFDELDELTQQLFRVKSKRFYQEQNTDQEVYDRRAGILAEFGKIICISVGFLYRLSEKKAIKVKSFYAEDEKTILQEFTHLLNQHSDYNILCGHNSKEFDIPYIARRCIVHGIPLASQLELWGKKPWEIPHIDTMDMWKFGDYKHFTSLDLLCHTLNIPSSKNELDGSQVADMYYRKGAIELIANYCEDDVVATIQIYLRLTQQSLVETQFIQKSVENKY